MTEWEERPAFLRKCRQKLKRKLKSTRIRCPLKHAVQGMVALQAPLTSKCLGFPETRMAVPAIKRDGFCGPV